jgi:iron complex outermembrane receptor protein
VKTKLFWEKFDNGLRMWDDKAQTLQYTSSAGLSVYNDWALGGSIEGGHDFGDRDTLKLATHIRRDTHSAWSNIFTDQYGTNGSTKPISPTCLTSSTNPNIPCFRTPSSTFVEDVYSLAAENTIHINSSLDFVQGVSNDWLHPQRADDYVSGGYISGTQYQPSWTHYSLADTSAFNWQGALIWRYSDTAKLFANVSDRTRFPTLFERFSTRFGGNVSNPTLAPEQATNYQLGWTDAFAPNSQVSILGYYATVKNMIQSVNISGTYVDQLGNIQAFNSTQNQNVGSGYRYGVDLAIDYAWTSTLKVGGNISYIQNQITNPNDPTFRPTGIPTMKGGVYVAWQPIDGLTLTGDVQVANDRWSQGAQNKYVTTGSYVLANVGADYKVRENLTVSGGVKNIFDNLYELTWGFPEAGRTYYIAMRQTF